MNVPTTQRSQDWKKQQQKVQQTPDLRWFEL